MTPKGNTKTEEQLITQVMSDLQSLNKIAVYKEEDNVIRDIIRGKSKNSILKDLKNKYSDITMTDIDNFIVLYKDTLYRAKNDLEKAYNRRLVNSYQGLTNNLTDLAIKANHLVDKYDNAEDNTNAVAALRVAADIFMKVAKLEGHFQDKPEVTVNMQMDKLVHQATGVDSDFKKKILKIVEAPDGDVVEAEYRDGTGKQNVRPDTPIVCEGIESEGSEHKVSKSE